MWSKPEEQRAATEGWKLVTTFENGSTEPRYEVVPAKAMAFIVDRAKGMSVFHLNTLKLLAGSRLNVTA